MPKIDIEATPLRTGSGYPPPYAALVAGRSSRRLGDAAGLTQFGANLVTLQPGAAASQRHWHENEDEFVWMVSGALVLVEDDGETPLGAGDAAAWKAGVAVGHHLVNRSDAPATFLVIGTRAAADVGHYTDPDVDMIARVENGRATFTRRDGRPFE
jgi:uncharacterized cupin superfamily protein